MSFKTRFDDPLIVGDIIYNEAISDYRFEVTEIDEDARHLTTLEVIIGDSKQLDIVYLSEGMAYQIIGHRINGTIYERPSLKVYTIIT